MMEERAEHAQEGEDQRLPAALLLGESAGGRAHRALQRRLCGRDSLDGVERAQGLGDRGQEDAAAGVQRVEAEAARAGDEDERWVDEPHDPARVASRVFVARCQEHAAGVIECQDDRLDRAVDRDLLDRPVDTNPARGFVRGSRHDHASPGRGAGRHEATSKQKPPRWGRLRFALGSCARARRGRPRGGATTTATACQSRSGSRRDLRRVPRLWSRAWNSRERRSRLSGERYGAAARAF